MREWVGGCFFLGGALGRGAGTLGLRRRRTYIDIRTEKKKKGKKKKPYIFARSLLKPLMPPRYRESQCLRTGAKILLYRVDDHLSHSLAFGSPSINTA